MIVSDKAEDDKTDWLHEEFTNERRLRVDERRDAIIHYWPGSAQAAFNLNFDDLCPLFDEHHNVDFGGKPARGINEVLEGIYNEFPHLKITHFVIPNANPRFCGSPLTNPAPNLSLTALRNSAWLDWLKNEEKTGRIEIAVHGYSHYNREVRARPHAEFAFSSTSETVVRLKKAIEAFASAGITIRGFRQPGWDIAADFNLLDGLYRIGLDYVAGSAPAAGLNYGTNRVSNLIPSFFRNMLNIPQNIGLDVQEREVERSLAAIVQRKGVISLKGHYTNLTTIPNSLTDRNIQNLKAILRKLAQKYDGKIWYAHLYEIAERWKGVENLVVEKTLSPSEIVIVNKSLMALRKLRVTIYDHSLPVESQRPDQLLDVPPNSDRILLTN